MNNLYKNKNWLYQKYIIEKLSSPRIAQICECASCTIYGWLKKYGIKTRNISEAQKGEMAYWWGKSPSKKVRKKISKSMVRFKAKTLKPELYHNKNWLYQMYVVKKLSSPRIADICSSYEAKIWYWIKKFNIPTRDRSEAARETWNRDESVRNMLHGLEKRPTYPETIFDGMTPKEVVYTGNRTHWEKLPNGKYKNPDFIVDGQNKVIEVFSDYWHRNDNPQELINLYKQIGINCLVIWEHEIKKTPNLVKTRVENFIN